MMRIRDSEKLYAARSLLPEVRCTKTTSAAACATRFDEQSAAPCATAYRRSPDKETRREKKDQPCSRGMRSVGRARKKGSRTTFVILNGDLVSADLELEKKTHPVFLGDVHAYRE